MNWSRRRQVSDVRARLRRAVGTAALGCLVALSVPPGATAAVRTLHLRYGPIVMKPAELKSAAPRVSTPQVPGFVTRMHAYVVDAHGRRMNAERVMLHHGVFRRLIPTR